MAQPISPPKFGRLPSSGEAGKQSVQVIYLRIYI